MMLGLLIFISYVFVAINTRAIAKTNYPLIAVSCMLFMSANFALTKYIVDAKTAGEFIWYIIGGCSADIVGTYISTKFDKKSTGE